MFIDDNNIILLSMKFSMIGYIKRVCNQNLRFLDVGTSETISHESNVNLRA